MTGVIPGKFPPLLQQRPATRSESPRRPTLVTTSLATKVSLLLRDVVEVAEVEETEVEVAMVPSLCPSLALLFRPQRAVAKSLVNWNYPVPPLRRWRLKWLTLALPPLALITVATKRPTLSLLVIPPPVGSSKEKMTVTQREVKPSLWMLFRQPMQL